MGRGTVIMAIVWVAVAVLYQQVFAPTFSDPGRRPVLREPIPEIRVPRFGKFPPLAAAPEREAPELDQVLSVKQEVCPKTCTGTAFAIDRPGLWMTARHVVEHCERVEVLADTALPALQVILHPSADLALISTSARAGNGSERPSPAMQIARHPRSAGEDGYGYGYPAGRPGATHGQLIGRLNMRASGAARYTAPVTAWAELSRSPDTIPRLQGISGGPLVDAAGNVIGVMVASSRRRGRFFGAAMPSLEQLTSHAGIEASRVDGTSTEAIDPQRYSLYGERLRDQITVAQVLCRGTQRGGRRPSLMN